MAQFGNAIMGFFSGGASGGGGISGSGTTNTLSKWASASSLTDSQITDSGTVVAISNWLQFENNASGYTGYGRIFNNTPFVIGGLTNYSDAIKPYITLGIVGGNNMANGTTFIQNSIGDVSQTSGTYTNTKITGRVLSFSGNAEHRFLYINPIYNDNSNPNTYTGTIRGLYYNLSQDNPFPVGANNIAWENVNGDIVFGNLATSGSDEMVVVDSVGKLKKEALLGVATSSTNGYLLSTDWTRFANFQILSGYQTLGSAFKSILMSNPSISNITQSVGLTTQQFRGVAVYVPIAQIITGVKWFQIIQGNFTSTGYNGVALFTYSGGTITRVALSNDSEATWETATTNTWGSVAFATPYSASEGLYYIGLLFCGGATAPSIGGTVNASTSNVNTGDFTNSSKLSFTLNAQTTIPSSLSLGGAGVTVSGNNPAVYLY
jgi:hypothetical protein